MLAMICLNCWLVSTRPQFYFHDNETTGKLQFKDVHIMFAIKWIFVATVLVRPQLYIHGKARVHRGPCLARLSVQLQCRHYD